MLPSAQALKTACAIAGGVAGSYIAYKQSGRVSFLESQAIGGVGTVAGYVVGKVLTGRKK